MHANWWDTQYLPETEQKVIETTLTSAEAKMLRGEDGGIDLILACRRFGFELFNIGLINTPYSAGRWPFAMATSLIETQVNDDREAALLSGEPTAPGDPYVITFTSPGAPEGFIHGTPVPLTVKVGVVDNGQRTGGYGEQRESDMPPSSQPKDYELKARTLHMLGVDWVKVLLLNIAKDYPEEGLKLKAADYFRVGVNDADADINIIPKHADADLDVEALIADVELVIRPGFWYTAGEKDLRVDVQGLPVSRVKVIVQQEHRYALTAGGTTANGGTVELTPEQAKALVSDGDLAAPDLKTLLDTFGLALTDWDIPAVDQLGTVVATPNAAGTAYVYTAPLPTGDYLYVNVKNDVLTGTLGENGEPATYSPGIRIGLFFKDGGADDMYQYDVTIANKEPEPEPEPKPEPGPGLTPGPGAERCMVTFETNGGTPASYPPQTVECGVAGKVTRPSPDPTREGYEFAGWFVRNAVRARAAQTLRMFDFAKDAVSSDTTLMAAWTEREEPGEPDGPGEPDRPDKPGENDGVQVPDGPGDGGADDGNVDGDGAGKPQEPSVPDGGQDSLPGGNGGSSAQPGGNAVPGLATTGVAVAGFAGLAALLVVAGVTLVAARRRRN